MSISRKRLTDAMDVEKMSNFETQLKISNRYLTVILILNNVVNVLLSSLATVLAVQLVPQGTAESTLVAMVTVVVTVLIVVFGEITPKLYARGNAPRFFNFSFPIIKVLDLILRPVTWALSVFSAILIKLFTGKKEVKPFISNEDILFEIDVGKSQGIIEEQESSLVRGALTLKDTYVKEIMVPRIEVAALDSDDSLREAIRDFDESKFSRLPVYKEDIDHVIGVCYAKDILFVMNSKGKDAIENLKVKEAMRVPYFVPETKKIDDLLQEMRQLKVHIAIVVDEYGGTAGLVTLEDVLEEMTGEIFDEYDIEDDGSLITKKDQHTYIVNGLTTINDIERDLGITFPESEFETIGGYLLKIFERVPKPGEFVSSEEFTAKVLESTKQRIIKVELKLKGMSDFGGEKTDRNG